MDIIYTLIEVYDDEVDVLRSTTKLDVLTLTLLKATDTVDITDPEEGVSTTNPEYEETLVLPGTALEEWVKGGCDGVLTLWAQGSGGRRWEVSADED